MKDTRFSLIPRILLIILLIAAALLCLLFFGPRSILKQGEETAQTDTVQISSSVSALSETIPVSQSSDAGQIPDWLPHETPETVPSETPEVTPEPTPEPLTDIENVPAGTLLLEDQIDAGRLEEFFRSYEISDTVFDRIYGDDRSFKTYCTVPREDLRYIKVLYFDFNGEIRVGELMVNALVADDITAIFLELFRNSYEIEQMVLVDEYGADDDLSIAHNNTSAFNFRPVTGGTTPSNHAYGCAIDINPKNNPYVEYDENGEPHWYDVDVELYLDRDTPDARERHMIDHEDLCFQLFDERGWTWGGDWENPVDYQHFEKPVYP